MRIAVVTGASSGIGREFVKQLDKISRNLDEIWVIARRAGRLLELEKQVKGKLCVCPMDLTKKEDLNSLKKLLENEKPDIRVLINASGYGVYGCVAGADYEETLGMIDLNCKALTAVTALCLPYIGSGGRIIPIASSAAFLPQPKFAVYAATKSYILSFSRSLNAELSNRRISVTAVCPGPVDTEFFKKKDCNIEKTFYKRLVMAKPDKVVKKALKDAIDRKEISVYGKSMQAFYILTKLLPHKLFLTILKQL